MSYYQELEQFIKPDMAFTRFFVETIMSTFQVVIDSNIYLMRIPKGNAGRSGSLMIDCRFEIYIMYILEPITTWKVGTVLCSHQRAVYIFIEQI
ncbi:hypothetical protein T10_5853 [Trichinella papuae]|uniref:Uncharacterized protein n=1 Tax=Trichinella papuae TaxID=268474 RepID=A0A0V1M3Q3_9BILA|nr:hypothetical protein T10_5853 [Trichinella papuae]